MRIAASLNGISGDTVAIMLAVGFVLGILPMYGIPTVLCLLAALAFRWNSPALQLLNQLISPLQLALALPFARLGERILGAHAAASRNMLSRAGEFTIQAVAGWICIAFPLGLFIYVGVSQVLRRRRPAWLGQPDSPA